MFLSEKKLMGVWESIKDLGDGIFDEKTVKLLMVDLREYARRLLKNLTKTSSADCQNPVEIQKAVKALAEFVDVADFIAHSDRDPLWCPMATNISSRADLFCDALSEQDDEKLQKVKNIDDAYTGRSVVLGMITAANYIFLSTSYAEKIVAHTTRVISHEDDVSLCIISLLQSMTIQVRKNDTRRAFLTIESYDGFYRLYCCVRVTDGDKRPTFLKHHTGNLNIRFPVVETSARDIDGVVRNTPATVDSEIGTSADQRYTVIETYRDAEGVLHVREIMPGTTF